jgi:hypothetical protein
MLLLGEEHMMKFSGFIVVMDEWTMDKHFLFYNYRYHYR